MTRTGGCLCGQVRYEIDHELGPVTACHCTQCRKQTGHYAAATPAPWDSIALRGEVTWYRSSPMARRGFCGTCGSYLFWEEGDGLAYVMAGSLDLPTGLRMDAHIFYADRGDYYRAGDGLPCFAAGRSGAEVPA
ncbi:GFA family protein [Jannaschia sp. S6380]|uniref:GFA family protein n=1 Tax=Jannaschia sp. S6380 TaxID=2926408 RepID=UPI001FF29D79|nr:GFA family protein [Jannaschia sp. S6380]MCK0167556.1 GFA family protein [Jannaschia sp. S6380]